MKDFTMSLFEEKQSEVIETFRSASRYLVEFLNNDNKYFDGLSLISRIYPSDFHLNKANTSETEAPLLDLHLSILDGFISCKIFKKDDDFDFPIVNCPYLDGDFLVEHPTVFIT